MTLMTRAFLALATWLGWLAVALLTARGAAAYELPSYEQRQTFSGSAFFVDENIWGYTAAFAERFNMPKKWITPGLEGVEAVAYRIIPGWLDCGYGGKRENCRRNHFCFLDVYIDEGKYPLPWASQQLRDWTGFDESASWIAEKGADRTLMPALHPWNDPKSGKQVVFYEDSESPNGNKMTLVRYRRQLAGNLTFLTFQHGCGTRNDMPFTSFVLIRDPMKTDDTKSPMQHARFHRFRLPRDYDKRIAARWDLQSKDSVTFYKKMLEGR